MNRKVEGKSAKFAPAPTKKASTMEEIQALLNYTGAAIKISMMRVTGYRG